MGFWSWYDSKIKENLIVVAIIQFVQIPHMVWNADLYLELGAISRVNPISDFLLYGVDLIEIVTIIQVSMMLVGRWKNR